MLAAGDEVSVRITKRGHPDIVYGAVVVSDDGNHVVLSAPWVEPESRDVGFATFGPGDSFIEHYWRDRWYSIKEVRTAESTVKGWYTDIARPARVQEREIIYEDLDLDLWLSGDRATILRLDEDEFAASGIEREDPSAAHHARAAFEHLAALAADEWDAVLTS